MDVATACGIMEINVHLLNATLLQRQYRKLSRRYHPDKSKTQATVEHFRRMMDAKTFLEHHLSPHRDEDEDEDEEHTDSVHITPTRVWVIVRHKLATVFGAEVVDNLMKVLIRIVETPVNRILEQMDVKLLKHLGVLFEERWNDDAIVRSLLIKIRRVVEQKTCLEVVLHPTLDDLLQDRVLTWYHPVTLEPLYVPLWVDETTFTVADGTEVVFVCEPALPAGVRVDADTNHVFVTLDHVDSLREHLQYIDNVWYWKARHGAWVPGTPITAERWLFPDQGMAVPSDDDLYDVSVRSHLYVDVG